LHTQILTHPLAGTEGVIHGMQGHSADTPTLHIWHGALWRAVVWNKWNSNFTLCISKNTSSPL